MHRNQQKVSKGGLISVFLILLNAIVLERGLVIDDKWYWLLFFTLPALLISQLIQPREK